MNTRNAADSSVEVQQLLAIRERLTKAGKGKGKAGAAAAPVGGSASAGEVLDDSYVGWVQ